MRKTIIFYMLGFLTSALLVVAAPPSRQNTYTSGDTILSENVTDNEDVIFNYLQAGVDTIKDNTIVNADVNASANIQSSKLNLTAISQSVANTGTFANTGNATITGTLTVTSTVTAGGGSNGKAVCWNGTTLGYCSDQPNASGDCTCN